MIYGPNEMGKTTLLEFIRRIFFGFPRQSTNLNPYPPLHGGAHGGRIIGILDDGNEIIIQRTKDSKGGIIKLQTKDGEYADQESVNHCLGNITRLFFENIYAISLNQLQSLKSLNEEEVKNRLYGAGLGLGSISLGDIKGALDKKIGALYSARGKKPKMNTLLRAIKDLEKQIRSISYNLGSYDTFVDQRSSLELEVNQLNDNLKNLFYQQAAIETKINIYPSYIDLVQAQEEIASIKDLSGYPSDAMNKYTELNNNINDINDRLNENDKDMKLMQHSLEKLDYDKEIMYAEPKIIQLQMQTEKYRSALRDITRITSEKDKIDDEITKEIKKIGTQWGRESVKEYQLEHLQKDIIESYKENFDRNLREKASFQDKIEEKLREKDNSSWPIIYLANPYWYAMYALVIIGLGNTIYSFLNALYLLGISSFILSMLGLLVSYTLREKTKSLQDPVIERIQKKIIDLETKEEVTNDEWVKFLISMNLDTEQTPNSTLKIASSIEIIQANIYNSDSFQDRIESMQKAIDSVNNMHNEVHPLFKKGDVTGDINTNLELFAKILDNTKGIKKDKEHLEKQIENLETKNQQIHSQHKDATSILQSFLKSIKVKDELELYEKDKLHKRSIELETQINESTKVIQSSVGVGKSYSKAIKELSNITPEILEGDIKKINDDIENSTSDRDLKIQTIGELIQKIESLASNEDLLEAQTEIEIKKQQLLDSSKEWAYHQIALNIFNKAVSKYENTRQPAVIKAATNLFSDITNKKYKAIMRAADSDELKIIDNNSLSKSILEMSQGTREELYFAMRLGLIEEYEKKSESMPIILDDVLVNFDDNRGLSAFETLNKFAKDRQVLLLTCHQYIKDMYSKYGVNEINLA